MLKAEMNLWNVIVDDVVKINTEDGDTLLVELPPQSTEFPAQQMDDLHERVARAFEQTFADKDVKILVIPSGMKVQLIKSSDLADSGNVQ